MAACYSSAGVFALPTVYVFSRIKGLIDCLRKAALPGIQIKAVELQDSILTEDQINEMKRAEIGLFDPVFLVDTHKYMPNLKWAHCTRAGLEPLLNLTDEPPFIITRHASDSFSAAMAEYVICQIISWERKFRFCWEGQRNKTWVANDMFCNFRPLDKLTVAVLGVGNMGSAVAKLLKDRGTTVYGLARNQHDRNHCFDEIFTGIERTIIGCDFIINTLPHTPLTYGILNNSILKTCLKMPVFINVGRGSIISETELIRALRNRWISGAILDVFENEPLSESSELWEMNQVIITPHIAALSNPMNVAEDFFDNLRNYIDGHGLKNVFNWSSGY